MIISQNSSTPSFKGVKIDKTMTKVDKEIIKPAMPKLKKWAKRHDVNLKFTDTNNGSLMGFMNTRLFNNPSETVMVTETKKGAVGFFQKLLGLGKKKEITNNPKAIFKAVKNPKYIEPKMEWPPRPLSTPKQW